MTLREYLEANDITQGAFAKKLRMSRDIVVRWLRGECYPRPHTARKIVRLTDNQVTLVDIYE
jgi:transcriptional regulator with XRE-family HTH domain